MKEFDFLLGRAERQAKKYDLVLNPNKKVIDTIIKGLIRNKKKLGKYYCPCKIEKIQKNICMCEDVRKGDHCWCTFFIENENL